MKNALWNVLEVIINYYQGFIVTYFTANFLNLYDKKCRRKDMFICAFIFGTLISFFNYKTVFEGILSASYFIDLFVFALICFKDNLIKKIFAAVIPVVLLLTVTSVGLNFFSSVFNITMENLIVQQNWQRLVALLAVQILLFATLKFLLELFDYTNEKFSFKDWLPIIFVLILSFILIALLHEFSLKAEQNVKKFLNIAYILVVVMIIFVLYLIVSLCKKNDKIRNLELLQLQEHYQTQYIDNANLQYETIRKLRHDMKDKYSAIYQLLKENETNKAMEFILQNENVLSNIETYVATDNNVVDAVINSKLSGAKAMGITVSCISVTHYYGIDDMDLCSLLSNMLENAITACPKATNSRIDVKISCESDVFTFCVKNSIKHSVLKTNPSLSTTKSNKFVHGLGVKIIKEISEKYNGRCDFFEQDDIFCVNVSLVAHKKNID